MGTQVARRQELKDSIHHMMAKVLFDTSVLVATLVKPHSAHARAFSWLKKAKSGEIAMIVSSHTLAETYAVLTTLPVSPRITPDISWRLIQEDILKSLPVSLTLSL